MSVSGGVSTVPHAPNGASGLQIVQKHFGVNLVKVSPDKGDALARFDRWPPPSPTMVSHKGFEFFFVQKSGNLGTLFWN